MCIHHSSFIHIHIHHSHSHFTLFTHSRFTLHVHGFTPSDSDSDQVANSENVCGIERLLQSTHRREPRRGHGRWHPFFTQFPYTMMMRQRSSVGHDLIASLPFDFVECCDGIIEAAEEEAEIKIDAKEVCRLLPESNGDFLTSL